MAETNDNVNLSVVVNNLNEIQMTGVMSVDSFDEYRINITCINGVTIIVEGVGLCVKEVNPDRGIVEATGQIKGFYCEEKAPSNGSFFKSLLFKR